MMNLIRVRNPVVIRTRKNFCRKDCLRLIPFILLFFMVLAFAFYIIPQNGLRMRSKNDVDKNPFLVASLLKNNVTTPEYWAEIFRRKLNKVLSDYTFHYGMNRKECENCSLNFDTNSLAACKDYPDSLVGHIDILPEVLNKSEDDIFKFIERPFRGEWKPNDCDATQKIAIVIPYRDREQHLLQLFYYLHPFLQRQRIQYRIFVVEQFGNSTFNKGAIMNAAFITILLRKMFTSNFPYPCFVFHDVDMMPENDYNLYGCRQYPTHLSVAVNEMRYQLPYYELVGGVFRISFEQFLKVNGYSNLFWGWGGEDDDMGHRLAEVKLPIVRPPPSVGRYTMISHVKRRPLVYKVRSKLVRTSGRRYRYDGLNTVQFTLIDIQYHDLYTKLVIDVGQPPSAIQQLQSEYEQKFHPNITFKVPFQ